MFISVIETEHNRKTKGSRHAVLNWFDRFGFRLRSAIFVCGQSAFDIRTRAMKRQLYVRLGVIRD